VRVADRDGADLDLARADGQRVDISFPLASKGSEADRSWAPHRDGYLLALHLGLDEAAGAVEHELAAGFAVTLADVPGDAARAVAALLDLAPVGVEDPVEDGGSGLAGRLQHEGLVEADARETVGEAAEGLRGRRTACRGIEDDEVVAESMHLREAHQTILAR
jgi:hypothetical protein